MKNKTLFFGSEKPQGPLFGPSGNPQEPTLLSEGLAGLLLIARPLQSLVEYGL